MATTKKVVIIGCGASGSQFAAKAAKNKTFEVTVITPFEYMEISLLMTKVLAVGPEEHEKALYPLLREDGVTYIIDSVQSVVDRSLTTVSGAVIPFDVCIVAVGQRIPLLYPNSSTEPTIDARKATIRSFHAELVRAKSIVVSGGGPIGTELAADTKLRFTDKAVTIVHPQAEVLSMMRDSFRLLANRKLEEMGVTLILSDRVTNNANGQVTLQSGKSVACDLFIEAHATGGNATFLPAGSRDAKNYAVVDATFKVQGLTTVFAVGDCSNYDKDKTYPKIDDQMPVLVHNVNAFLTGKPLKNHVKGVSFMGKVEGPIMVALGHGAPKGYGIGPNIPGCYSFCWFCCCCCSTPGGSCVAKMKNEFNNSIVPKKGVGIHS